MVPNSPLCELCFSACCFTLVKSGDPLHLPEAVHLLLTPTLGKHAQLSGQKLSKGRTVTKSGHSLSFVAELHRKCHRVRLLS